MSRHVILQLMASLIIFKVCWSSSLVSPSSINPLKFDHTISDFGLIRILKRAMRIEDGVFLKTKRSIGEAFRRHRFRRDNVLKEFNDWEILKNGRLWDDNLIRSMKRGGVRSWDDTLFRMI